VKKAHLLATLAVKTWIKHSWHSGRRGHDQQEKGSLEKCVYKSVVPCLIWIAFSTRNSFLLTCIFPDFSPGPFWVCFIALAIGAAFIAVWFTKASDLWQKSENYGRYAPRILYMSIST